MDNKFRMIMAVVLSASIMFAFTIYQSKTQSNSPVETTTTQNDTTNSENQSVTIDKSVAQEIDVAEARLDEEKASQKITLENDLVVAEFQNGNLISYELKNFYKTQSKNDSNLNQSSNSNVNMVEYQYNDIYPFYMSFNNFENTLSGRFETKFYFSRMVGDSVEFIADVIIDGEPITITKTFSLGEKPYQIINDLSFQNNGSSDIEFFYSYFLGSGIGPYKTIKDSTREDLIRVQYLANGKGTAKKMLEGNKNKPTYQYYEGGADFVDIDNRYFAIIVDTDGKDIDYSGAIIPNTSGQKPASEYVESYHIASLASTVSLASGQALKESKSVYMGPKSRVLFNENYKEENYRAVYHESFIFINLRPLIYWLDIALNALYGITKNYALAIMLFTLIFKILTFPLTHKSYKSMKRMQLVNPKIEKIRQVYKDDPEAMNKEIWKTYKKEKVSPFGGCLPTLLPFPILIAFFYLMQSMIELRNASFLWITDLSSPDRLFVFPSDFPLIGGFNFNLIPIIMALTSYVTMKLQPTASGGSNNAMGNQMKMMSMIFPVMMLFMLYNFASGLAIYWTTQNVLALVQQLITKYIENKKGVEAIIDDIPVIETKKERKKRSKKKTY